MPAATAVPLFTPYAMQRSYQRPCSLVFHATRRSNTCFLPASASRKHSINWANLCCSSTATGIETTVEAQEETAAAAQKGTTTTTSKANMEEIAKCDWYGSEHTIGPVQPLVIGVAGGTASGKTSVCKAVIASLKDNVSEHQRILSLSLDCFYKNLPDGFSGDVFDYNFDHPDAFDWEAVLDTLTKLKEGRPVEIPQYDYKAFARSHTTTPIHGANVILFDGILAFYDPAVRDLFDIKIFVDADADTRLVRRIRRDIVSRGRDIQQVLDQYERTVKPAFENYIAPTKKHADIIMPRGVENTVAVDLLLQHVKYKLRKQAQSVTSGSQT